MNKQEKSLKNLTKSIDELFNLLSFIEENKLDSKNLEKLQKKIRHFKKNNRKTV